jgi:hypothetical protein
VLEEEPIGPNNGLLGFLILGYKAQSSKLDRKGCERRRRFSYSHINMKPNMMRIRGPSTSTTCQAQDPLSVKALIGSPVGLVPTDPSNKLLRGNNKDR